MSGDSFDFGVYGHTAAGEVGQSSHPGPLAAPRVRSSFAPMVRPFTRAAAIAVTLAMSYGCDNDVELLSDDPGMPVVFGLIDGSQDRQLLSISRTFRFSDGGNAILSAQNPDSVYYSAEELTVTARNARTGATTTLQRVDLTAEDLRREEGDFPVTPVIAYRYSLEDIEAQPGDSVVVEGTPAGADAFTLGGTILTPLEFPRNGAPPDVYSLTGTTGSQGFRFRRGEVGADIDLFEVGLDFAYTETGPDGTSDRSIYYPLALAVELDGDGTVLQIERQRINGIYGFLNTRLEASPDISREFRNISTVITGGDGSYAEYIALIRANSGITATQELPPFTNVTGGLGLVAAVTRVRQLGGGTLTPASFDTLRIGSQTRALNFR